MKKQYYAHVKTRESRGRVNEKMAIAGAPCVQKWPGTNGCPARTQPVNYSRSWGAFQQEIDNLYENKHKQHCTEFCQFFSSFKTSEKAKKSHSCTSSEMTFISTPFALHDK